jgi:predicted HTH transcriptional regulator
VGGEDQSIEFKNSLKLRQDIGAAISAFANTSGGVILIGVSDDGKVTGVTVGRNKVSRQRGTPYYDTHERKRRKRLQLPHFHIKIRGDYKTRQQAETDLREIIDGIVPQILEVTEDEKTD